MATITFLTEAAQAAFLRMAETLWDQADTAAIDAAVLESLSMLIDAVESQGSMTVYINADDVAWARLVACCRPLGEILVEE